MVNRWTFAAGVALTLLASGCSSGDKATVAATTAAATSAAVKATDVAAESQVPETGSEPVAAVEPLDSSQCVDVTGASLDLSVATTAEEARTAADTLDKYEPPTGPKNAIEHFVTTVGAQFDDPEYTKQNKVLDDWVHQLCPV